MSKQYCTLQLLILLYCKVGPPVGKQYCTLQLLILLYCKVGPPVGKQYCTLQLLILLYCKVGPPVSKQYCTLQLLILLHCKVHDLATAPCGLKSPFVTHTLCVSCLFTFQLHTASCQPYLTFLFSINIFTF